MSIRCTLSLDGLSSLISCVRRGLRVIGIQANSYSRTSYLRNNSETQLGQRILLAVFCHVLEATFYSQTNNFYSTVESPLATLMEFQKSMLLGGRLKLYKRNESSNSNYSHQQVGARRDFAVNKKKEIQLAQARILLNMTCGVTVASVTVCLFRSHDYSFW